MKVKKIPLRTCVVTHEKLPKKDLLRIVRTPDGIVEADLTGKKNGRGAYIKNDVETLEMARKTKVLERHLEVLIDDKVYDTIKDVIINNK